MPLYLNLLTYYNTFVCAEKNGSVACNRVNADDWECLEATWVEKNKYTIKGFHGKYLMVLGANNLVFKGDEVTMDCIFEVITFVIFFKQFFFDSLKIVVEELQSKLVQGNTFMLQVCVFYKIHNCC